MGEHHRNSEVFWVQEEKLSPGYALPRTPFSLKPTSNPPVPPLQCRQFPRCVATGYGHGDQAMGRDLSRDLPLCGIKTL